MGKKTVIAAGLLSAGLFLWPFLHAWGRKPPLTVAAFGASRAAYEAVIPLFRRHWKEKTGKDLAVRASYGGSGALSRALIGGFEADVAAFAQDTDLDRLEKAGLLTRPWRKAKRRGVVAASVVVLAVRPGNPKGIRDWVDLAKPGVRVLLPDPKASTEAQWNFLALYGAADRGAAEPYVGGDAGAFRFAAAAFKNVSALDADARASILDFERGRGDAAVAWESELAAARLAGRPEERVVPRSTVLVQNPAAVVDAYADKHGLREEAEAFLDFLWTPAAQEAFARAGFRPVDVPTLARHRGAFPPVLDLWSVEELGGWSNAGPVFFGPGGIYDGVLEDIHAAS